MSKRWLLFEVLGNNCEIEKKELAFQIKNALYTNFGTFVNLKVSFWLHEYENHTGILEVNQEGIKLLRTTLTLITSINEKKLMINDIIISGTLKKLKEESKNTINWKEERKKLRSKLFSLQEVTRGESLFQPFKKMKKKWEDLLNSGSGGN